MAVAAAAAVEVVEKPPLLPRLVNERPDDCRLVWLWLRDHVRRSGGGGGGGGGGARPPEDDDE